MPLAFFFFCILSKPPVLPLFMAASPGFFGILLMSLCWLHFSTPRLSLCNFILLLFTAFPASQTAAGRARLLRQGGAPGYQRPPAFWVYFPAGDTVGGCAVRPLPPAPRVRPRRGLRSPWGWQLLSGRFAPGGAPRSRGEPRGEAKAGWGASGRGGQTQAAQGALRAAGGLVDSRRRSERDEGWLVPGAARPRGRRLRCPCCRFAVEHTGGRDMGRVRSARGPRPDLFHFPSHSAPGCAADSSSSRSARAA